MPCIAPLALAQDLARFEGLIARGDTAWTGGKFAAAKAAYGAALGLDSVGSSRAVYRLAVLHSWDGHLPLAIPLFQRYTRIEPRDEEGRIALGRAYAWHGETDKSVAVYDSILGRDTTYRDAALGAALALAWGSRYQPAIERYDQWLAANPRDVEAELARARTLAWWGKLGEAERTYARIAARGERLEADKGIALVAAWRGDLLRSERLWRVITDRQPKDAEAWVGLAQVLRWSGRPDDASAALQAALAVNPDHADAAEQLRWVRADLAPATEPSVAFNWDSDDNRSVVVQGGLSLRPFQRARLTLIGSRREAELQSTTGQSTAARASLRLALGGRLTVVGDLGATRMTAARDALAADRTVGTGALGATVRLTSRLAVGATARRTAFDETAALLLSGVDVTSFGAQAEWEPIGRLALTGGVERAALRGGSGPNERRSAFAALRWRARRQLRVSLSGRRFTYEEQRRDGYFAPAEYLLGEGGIRWTLGRDLGWVGHVEAGLGAQQVGFGGPSEVRPTQRLRVGLGYRPRPGSEVSVGYGYSNVSGNAAEGNVYRAHALSLRARIVW